MKNSFATGRLRFPLTLAALAAIAGCAAGEPPVIDTRPGAEVSFDGLNRVLNSGADEAWARAGLDLSIYTKVKLESAGIEYRPGGESSALWAVQRSRSGPYEVTEAQKARLEEIVRDVFLEELREGQKYAIVDEPGPDVLVVRGRLLDVVSYVPPEPVGRADVFLNRVGEATLVVEFRDSITDAILVRSIDRRAAERPGQDLHWSNPVNNTAEIRRVARRWATSLREALDEFMGPQP